MSADKARALSQLLSSPQFSDFYQHAAAVAVHQDHRR
jgi:hypothetical protein